MNRRMRTLLAALVGTIFLLALAGRTFSITHAEMKMACPICGTENMVTGILSWGGYIYMFPSRFQVLFFPATDPSQLYHCKRCHYTAWPEEFEKLPPGKRPAVEKILEKVWHANHEEDYKKIPMSERLDIARQIYEVFDLDDDFWCHFYRLEGYFLQEEGKSFEAKEARKKALHIATRLATREDRAGERKELLVIAAAMHHYLADDQQALQVLEQASALKYSDSQLDAERNKNVDEYFSRLIHDYQRAIREGLSTDTAWDEEVTGNRPQVKREE